jgi:cellulose biosynthesis protein BcsQ
MALANVAALLARWGQRVLVIDWDLEAPGLERYFGSRLRGSRREIPGLVDLISSFDTPGLNGQPTSPIDWRSCLMKASIPQGEAVDIIHAGRQGDDYLKRLRAIDWDRLFNNGFGRELERMRSEWKRDYNYILIDSRTGITDIGGICSILLPDYLLSLFTTNEQSVLGVKDTMARARTQQQDLPLDRQRLVIVPIAARDESNTEYKRAEEWRKRFARELSEFYRDWIHKDETAESVLDYLKIPYVAFWSFGEPLPVLEEDVTNPKTLGYSYGLIARLIHSRLNWAEVKVGREATAAQAKQAAEVQTRLAEASKARTEALAQQQAEAERVLERRRGLVLERFVELLGETRQRIRLADGLIAVCAVVIASVVGVSGYYYYFLDRSPLTIEWAISSVLAYGAIAGIPLGIVRRARHARTRDELERERAAYDIGLGLYAGVPSEPALQIFGDRIELIALGRDEAKNVASSPAVPAPAPSGPPGSFPPSAPTSGDTVAPPLPRHQPSYPPGSLPPPPPAVSFDETKPVDVFLSYAAAGISRDWALEFTPLFSRWLSEMLGRDASVFFDQASLSPGAHWDRSIDQALSTARTAVVILSRRYLQSEWGRRELDKLLNRLPAGRIFPLRLESMKLDDLPSDVARIQWIDFSDVAYVGEGFAKSERYIDFQDRIRDLAKRVANAIENSAPDSPIA